MKIGCVILASGYGRRFGANKLLALQGGVPLYCRVLDALPPALFSKAVLTSQYQEILDEGAQRGYLCLTNPLAEEGISAGIRLGLAPLLDTDGVLFSVCDQPNLTTDSIKQLINSFLESPTAIYALSWQGRRGNPVLFPQHLYPELLSLTGDTGGSGIIRRHPELLRLTACASPWELADVDVPADLSSSCGHSHGAVKDCK